MLAHLFSKPQHSIALSWSLYCRADPEMLRWNTTNGIALKTYYTGEGKSINLRKSQLNLILLDEHSFSILSYTRALR